MKEKPKGLDEALKQRDQLLEFDRNRYCTKIIIAEIFFILRKK